MAKAIIMPKVGITVESCILDEIKVKEGDQIKVGDVLFTFETDKTSIEEESKEEGTVLKILFEEGDEVPVFANVMVVGEPGEDISEFENAAEQSEQSETESTQAQPTQASEVSQNVQANENVRDQSQNNISPRAKQAMSDLEVDMQNVTTASGANGRIIQKDVIDAKNTPEFLRTTQSTGQQAATSVVREVQSSEPERIEYSGIRKAISSSMTKSLNEAAQLTMFATVDATKMLQLRADIKNNMETYGLANITINDILQYAAAKTLVNFPQINAHAFEDHLMSFKNVNIGMAVDTDRGLMVPVLKNVEQLSLNDIALQSKELIMKTREGSLSPKEMQGGTFTITNLGTLGITGFTPIINRPQVAILGVGGLETKIKMVNGEPKYYQAMHISLTMDHKPIDGLYAAKFLNSLVKNMENINLTLIK